MSNTTESGFEYFELFLTGMKEEYDSLLAEVKMAAHATVHDYESIGTRIGFLTAMQIVAENGNVLLESDFDELTDEEYGFLVREPEIFIARMIDVAEEACRTPLVKQQVSNILKRDFTMLNIKRTLEYLETGAEKAGVWLREAIQYKPKDEPIIAEGEKPRATVR